MSACAPGKGSAGGAATTCDNCDATKFCATCKAVADCVTCTAGYVFTAGAAGAAGTCAAYTGTKHASCKLANGDTDSSCMSCDDAQNRAMELDAPVAPATTGVAKAVGKCICKAGYGDKSKLSTPDWVCAQCPANTSACTFGATGVTDVTCNTGFFKAGLNCLASTAVDVAGFFWDTSATTSAFKACTASLNCLTCNSTSCL